MKAVMNPIIWVKGRKVNNWELYDSILYASKILLTPAREKKIEKNPKETKRILEERLA